MDFETERDAEHHEPRRAPSNRLTSVVSFEMRCPNCRKLYSVPPQVFSADEDDVMKFECVACESVFLTVKPEFQTPGGPRSRVLETQLAPLADWNESLRQARRAAAAARRRVEAVTAPEVSLTPTFVSESTRAAIAAVPLRAHPVDDIEMAQSAETLALWDSIIEKYEDVSRHTAFLKHCFEEKKLAFATYKYSQVLRLAPQDLIARRMQREAQGLISYDFDGASPVLTMTTWAVPLRSFTNLILFLGGIALVTGMGLPHMRAIAGMGTAMIAIVFGLRSYLRRPR